MSFPFFFFFFSFLFLYLFPKLDGIRFGHLLFLFWLLEAEQTLPLFIYLTLRRISSGSLDYIYLFPFVFFFFIFFYMGRNPLMGERPTKPPSFLYLCLGIVTQTSVARWRSNVSASGERPNPSRCRVWLLVV